MLGAGVHARAAVHDNGHAVAPRERHRDARPRHAREAPAEQDRGRDGGARRAEIHDSVRLPRGQALGRHAGGIPGLRLHRAHGLVVHPDDPVGRHDLHAVGLPPAGHELSLEDARVADEEDVEV